YDAADLGAKAGAFCRRDSKRGGICEATSRTCWVSVTAAVGGPKRACGAGRTKRWNVENVGDFLGQRFTGAAPGCWGDARRVGMAEGVFAAEGPAHDLAGTLLDRRSARLQMDRCGDQPLGGPHPDANWGVSDPCLPVRSIGDL